MEDGLPGLLGAHALRLAGVALEPAAGLALIHHHSMVEEAAKEWLKR